MSNEEVKGKKKKGGKIALVLCVLIIAALCAVIYFLLHKEGDDEKTKRNVVVNEKNVDQVLSEIEDRVPAGSYQVGMNSTWNFKNGTAASDDAYVENAKANQNPVYFEITRSDTEEKIFESPVIPVGSYLDKITLDEELSAGTYDCIMTYHLLDDEQETISTVKVGLTIIIAS